MRKTWWWAAGLALVIGTVAAGLGAGGSSVAATSTSSASIVATYGVGGVLKTDGNLYQWRPERHQWVTIDESFKIDGESNRNVLPLPVAPSEVVRMEGFGFLVTRSGACWLYNLDSNKWENIGRP
jgi:hypothetical protein